MVDPTPIQVQQSPQIKAGVQQPIAIAPTMEQIRIAETQKQVPEIQKVEKPILDRLKYVENVGRQTLMENPTMQKVITSYADDPGFKAATDKWDYVHRTITSRVEQYGGSSSIGGVGAVSNLELFLRANINNIPTYGELASASRQTIAEQQAESSRYWAQKEATAQKAKLEYLERGTARWAPGEAGQKAFQESFQQVVGRAPTGLETYAATSPEIVARVRETGKVGDIFQVGSQFYPTQEAAKLASLPKETPPPTPTDGISLFKEHVAKAKAYEAAKEGKAPIFDPVTGKPAIAIDPITGKVVRVITPSTITSRDVRDIVLGRVREQERREQLKQFERLSFPEKVLGVISSPETTIATGAAAFGKLETFVQPERGVAAKDRPSTFVTPKYGEMKRIETTTERAERLKSEAATTIMGKRAEYTGLSAAESAAKFAIESPVTLAIGTGAGAKVATMATREGLVAAAKLTAKGGIPAVSKYVPTLLRYGERSVEPLVNIGGIGLVGAGIVTAPTIEEAAGRAFLLGSVYPSAKFGWEKGGDIYSSLKYIRYPTVKSPIGEISPRGIVETPPGMKPEEFIKTFRTEEGGLAGYHASAEALPKQLPIGVRAPGYYSDVPGLYITPEQMGATAFPLGRAGRQSLFPKLGDIFKSEPLEPTVQKITGLKAVERLPPSVREEGWIQPTKAREFLGLKGLEREKGLLGEKVKFETVTPKIEPGKAVLTPKVEAHLEGGAEAEAVVVPGTTLEATGKPGKFRFEGKTIKFQEMRVRPTQPGEVTPSEMVSMKSVGAPKGQEDIFYKPGMRTAGLGLFGEGLIKRDEKTQYPIERRFETKPEVREIRRVEERLIRPEERLDRIIREPSRVEERISTSFRPEERVERATERQYPTPEYRMPTLPRGYIYPRPTLDIFYSEYGGYPMERVPDWIYRSKDEKSEEPKKRKRLKEAYRYVSKKRISPIFEKGVTKLFEEPIPTKKKSILSKVKKSKEFDLGFGEQQFPL